MAGYDLATPPRADTPAWPTAAGALDGLTAGTHDGTTSGPRDGLASGAPGAASWPGTAFSGPARDGNGDHSAAAWARSTTAPSSRRWPAGTRLIALIAALVLVAGGAALLGARFLPHAGVSSPPQRGPSSPAPRTGSLPGTTPGVFGIPTVTKGCPAASVRSAAARCPQDPECWNGLVIISGSVTASTLACTAPHYWQTYAIAILPADVRTYDQNIVQGNASVRALCSMRILLRSRLGPARLIPPRLWEIAVMPPDENAFDSGARAYRCVAHLLRNRNPRTSQFGP
jgi:hypothetical protein